MLLIPGHRRTEKLEVHGTTLPVGQRKMSKELIHLMAPDLENILASQGRILKTGTVQPN